MGSRRGVDAREHASEERAVSKVVGVVLMTAIVIALAATVATMLTGFAGLLNDPAPQAAFSFEYDDDVEDPSAYHSEIESGTSEDRQYPIGNAGVLPVVVYLDATSSGAETTSESYRLDRGETANMTVTLSAPPENGYYVRSVREYRYPVLLPKSVLDGLYSIHPTLPFFVINAIVGGVVVAVGTAFGWESTRIRYRRGRDRGHRT